MKNTTSRKTKGPASAKRAGKTKEQNNQKIDLEKVYELSRKLLRKQWGKHSKWMHFARDTRTGEIVGQLGGEFDNPVWSEGLEPFWTEGMAEKIEEARNDSWQDHSEKWNEVFDCAVQCGLVTRGELSCYEWEMEFDLDNIRNLATDAFCDTYILTPRAAALRYLYRAVRYCEFPEEEA
jgi:hypothetical protein